MTASSITGRRWLGSLLACLALAAVPRGVSGQEGRLRLELPEVVVVGEGLPVIPVQRPLRPLPRKLSADRIVVLPTEEETLRPPVSIAFDPGPAFTPKVARPNDCYKSPSSARRLINQEGARAHFRVGYLLFLSNEMFEAEAQFQAGLDKSPDAVTASFLGYWLGEAYLRRGEEAKAREAWARVAGNPVGPLAGSASFRLGLMSYRQGDYPDALARMERVVERFPGHPQAAAAAFLAGESSLKMGDSIRAVWHYAGVPQTLTDRGNRELLKLSKFREGMTLFRLKRFQEASRSLGDFSEFPGVEADLLRPSR
ncbi:MAG: tetratricopeptide repeat protein, partial [bacterium]